MDNLPSSEAALFRPIIAAKDSPFSAAFSAHPPGGAIFAPNFLTKGGHFGDSWIAHDFPKILEKSWTIRHRLTRPYFEP